MPGRAREGFFCSVAGDLEWLPRVISTSRAEAAEARAPERGVNAASAPSGRSDSEISFGVCSNWRAADVQPALVASAELSVFVPLLIGRDLHRGWPGRFR